ncbi:MAG: DNA-processing protein DprA [Candidatus Limnocylindrales bacterium]
MGALGPLGPVARSVPASVAERSAPRDRGMLAEERQAWVVLSTVEGVGGRTLMALVATHGTARRVLRLAANARLGRGLAAGPDGWHRALPAATLAGIESAAREPGRRLAAVASAGVWTVTLLDPDYPGRLLTLASPPPVLFGQGDFRSLAVPRAIAIVGTRRASPVGRFEAARAAAACAGRGVEVVSGLAVGIDGAAHASAVEAGGVTVAAIGSGHQRPGPVAHRRLVRQILQRGALIGELPPDARATRGTYPRRNRLIVALADAVLVVEAPARSGALITAHLALEQGVPLYAAPGRPSAVSSEGCRGLLAEGIARPFADVAELCAALGWADGVAAERAGAPAAATSAIGTPAGGDGNLEMPPMPRAGAFAGMPSLGGPERDVARLLAGGPATMTELLAGTRGAPGEVAAALTLLQLRGLVRVIGPLYLPAGPLLLTAP